MARTKSAKRKAARLAGKKADVKKAKKTQAKKAKKKTENSPKAKKNVNSNAFESLYGSIKKESKRWGKRTRAMVESAKIKAVEFKGGQRPGPKKKKQKKGKFSMKLPPLVPPGQVPWWKNPTAAPPESKKIKILNSISVDSQTMWLLNEELEAFCKYVQLSRQECHVRDYTISVVQKVAESLYPNKIEESHCEVFGSYAARQVATFESDVDIAIGGVLAASKKGESDNADENKSSNQIQDLARKEKPQSLPAKQQKQDDQNIKKQSKVLKWKAAIDEFEQQTKVEQSNGADGQKSESIERKNDKFIDIDGDNNHEPSVFVIDRAGVKEEEKQHDGKYENGEDDGASEESDQDRKLAPQSQDRHDLNGDDCASDDDTADKMEGMKGRDVNNDIHIDDNDRLKLLALPDAEEIEAVNSDDVEDGEIEEELITTPRKRSRSHSMISLSSSTTCSDNQSLDEDGLEVAFVTEPKRRKTGGIDEEIRGMVIKKLNKIGKKMRKTGIIQNLFVRKKAKVPIINMTTSYGYECDIGVGGHTGVDTSGYAAMKISKYKSFVPVVLLLKIILNQQELDKPFTGGLGSFKLYVLVASHIEEHLALNGSDNAAEVLLTFLFRYGDIKGFKYITNSARTNLMSLDEVTCRDGGSADILTVFRRMDCIEVFRSCFWQLYDIMAEKTGSSLLGCLVDANSLRKRRSLSLSRIPKKYKAIDFVAATAYKRKTYPPRESLPRHAKDPSLPPFEDDSFPLLVDDAPPRKSGKRRRKNAHNSLPLLAGIRKSKRGRLRL